MSCRPAVRLASRDVQSLQRQESFPPDSDLIGVQNSSMEQGAKEGERERRVRSWLRPYVVSAAGRDTLATCQVFVSIGSERDVSEEARRTEHKKRPSTRQ